LNPVLRPWFTPAIVFLVCWTLTTHGKYSASGDEPHYLMVCQSLWADGDLDLRNNYQNNDGRLFGAADLEVGLHARENKAGRLFPAHDIGVPLLLTPIYVVATSVAGISSESILNRFRMNRGLFAYSLISLCIIGLVTTAAVITRSALIAQGTTPTLASGVAIVAWLSPPVLSNSFLIFPEPFALWVTALALRFASSDEERAPGSAHNNRGEAILAAVLGLLPWFHRKYVIYAAALALVAVWQRRERIGVLETRDQRLLLASFIVPQIALAVWTWYVWGNLGGPLMLGGAPFSWEAFRNGVFGSLIDRENGLLVWAPIYVLLPAAWALAGKGYLRWLLPVGSLFLLSAAHLQWWGGFSPAARFLVPLIPIFASVYARAMGHRRFAYACMILLIPQLFISADGWQHTRSLWPQGDGHNRILSDLLGLVGASETLIPSLRTSNAIGAAMIGTIGLGLVNLLGWAAVKQYAPHQRSVTPRISSTD
jgi:hypothetical protein